MSCEQGVCGTCLTPVLEGIPEHRDLYQTDEEKEKGYHKDCYFNSLAQKLNEDATEKLRKTWFHDYVYTLNTLKDAADYIRLEVAKIEEIIEKEKS